MTKEDTILEHDEVLAAEDEMFEKAEQKVLLDDTRKNYAMLRNLHLLPNADGLGALEFIRLFFDGPDGFGKWKQRVMRFQHWQAVEGGQIQIRVSSDKNDDHGYVVVRPEDDLTSDVYLRVFDGEVNSVAIMPRSDESLPRQGSKKEAILGKMKLVSEKQINDYTVWLERMKKVK